MGFLANKRVLIVGLASNRSIAYGIASSMHQQGATLAFTYQNDKLKSRVEEMAAEFNSTVTVPCDVSDDAQISAVMQHLEKTWDGLDIIVHAVAYAPADQLEGNYLEHINRDGFRIAHDISAYSFGALAKAGLPLLRKGQHPALLTLSYLGAERVVPNYNVMGLAKASLEANVRYLANCAGPEGIRVNGISAGPIRTLAASGIKGFKKMLSFHERSTPLRETTTIEQVGNVAAFLCSDLALGVTGEIVHVDGGFHAVAISDAMMDAGE